MPRALVVSIHDVSPFTWDACRDILAQIRFPVSLLVIPNHHSQGHFLEFPEFCSWLRQRESQGDEVVIHGYKHRRDSNGGETFSDRLITQHYTAGEGEFFDMGFDTAFELVSKACRDFAECSLHPSGFIAPAWLLSEEARSALHKLKIRYTTTLRTIDDLTQNVSFRSQSLCWSSRSSLRRGISCLWNALLYRRLQTFELLRLAIHPIDLVHPLVWRQVQLIMARASESRSPLTYRDWITRS
jgi:uncharacterized protein